MINPVTWKILGIITVILLVIYRRGKNSVWGGLTIGLVIGFIIALFSLITGNGFSWGFIGKTIVIGVIVGFIAELLAKLSLIIKK